MFLIHHDIIATMMGAIPLKDLYSILNQLRTFLFSAGIILVVVGIIVGGIMRATAFGNDKQIASSNVALAAAVIGLLIIVLAVPITNGIAGAFQQQQINCTGAAPAAGGNGNGTAATTNDCNNP